MYESSVSCPYKIIVYSVLNILILLECTQSDDNLFHSFAVLRVRFNNNEELNSPSADFVLKNEAINCGINSMYHIKENIGRGRPRLRWEDCVKRDVRKAGEEEDWKKKTRDRGGWKRLSDEAVKKLRAAPHP